MKRTIAFVCALALLCLSGCGGPSSDSGVRSDSSAPAGSNETAGTTAESAAPAGDGVLDTALNADIVTMDCMHTTQDYLVPMNINSRLFDILVHEDGSNEIVHSLCQSHTVSDDGLTYTFKLREGVQFSNGEPLTAEDVIFTFEHLLDPESVNADIPLEIKGAQEFLDGTADSIEGLAAMDEHTVAATLTAPNAGFLAELTTAQMGILDKTSTEAAQNFGVSCEETVGCGPYVVTEWVPNDHITLVRSENFWGEKPSVEKCVVHIIPDVSTTDLMYQNGELDILDLDKLDSSIVNNTYMTKYADRVISRNRASLTMMVMNANDPYLSDVRVRKAVQKAVDRQAIIDSIYNGRGQVQNGITPAGIVGYNPDGPQITYDPEGAKALLAEAGYGEGEVSIELAFDAGANPDVQLVYQIVQQQLQAVGINAQIKTYDHSSWLDTRMAGEMCSFIATWTMDYNDPANIMYTFFGSEDKTKGRSLNYQRAGVMERVAAASAIVDDSARYAEYQELENIIVHEDAAWLPLYQLPHLYAVSQNVVSFVPHWAGYGDFYIADVVMK